MNSGYENACNSKREKWRSADVKTAENVDFSTLLLPEKIQLGLKNCGFEKPSPVQLQAIPLGRCGIDLVVQAKSGTGKTCVMAVIALDSLVETLPNTQVLVLAPTREIASQICGVIQDLGCAFCNLTCDTFIGGLPLRLDKSKLPCCQIVVGTPGRIKQLIDMELLQTESIRLFVVDEADRLFDKQFKEDINWIFSSLPSRKQILALSATYPNELSKFLEFYMETPVYVRISSEDPALLGIAQCFRSTPYHPMLQVTDSAKFDILLDILNSVTFSQCMIFCQRQTKAQDLADNLVLKGFPTLAICSTLEQVRRLEIIQELKSFQCRVLVSTDLTARGIDAENVDLVINFEIPYEAETYLHRIGRAGRYGTRGMSISLASDGDELKRLKSFQKKFLFKVYELPDPIPVNLWDKILTLQALVPEETQNKRVLSNSNGCDNTNGLNHPKAHDNSTTEKKPDHSLSVNHSETILDSGRNVPDVVHCSNGTLEANGEVLNGCVLSDSTLENIALSKPKQLVSTEKECEPQIVNQDCSTSTDLVDNQEQHGVQNSYSVESKTKSSGDMEENTSVEMPTEKSIDRESVCVSKEGSLVSLTSKMLADTEENSASSASYDLCNSIDLDVSKQEDLSNNGVETNPDENLTGDHDELVKTDSPKGRDLKGSETTRAQDEQTKQSDVPYCPLFQKWEKYFRNNAENVDISSKDVSDVLVPLSNIKTGDSECNLSYSDLVHSWESPGNCSVTDPIKLYPKASVSSIIDIPQAQTEILQKYIYHDKCQFFSRVKKNFETESDSIPCESKTSEETSNDISVCDGDSDILSTPKSLGGDQLESTYGSVSPNENVIPFETADPELRDDLLRNAVVTTVEGQNHSEINCSAKKCEDAVDECVITCEDPGAILPDTAAVGPHDDKTDGGRFLPFCTDKSPGKVKQDPSADKSNPACNSDRNYLTESVYDSVTCGIKHSKIVSLPPIPSGSSKESSFANRKGSDSVSISNQKPTKNQSVKKKVRGASKKTNKHKQERLLEPVQVSEQNIPIASDAAEGNHLYQETETRQSRKNVAFDNVSAPRRVPEHVAGRKKKRNVTGQQEIAHDTPNSYENEIRSAGAYQNTPVGFTNSGVGDNYSPCVAFAPHYVCCCRLPHVQDNNYFQPPIPGQNLHPQYYYQKFLEQWYYIQELTYSYHRR